MLALLDQTYEPITASETEAIIAKEAAGRLRSVADTDQDITVHVDTAVNIAVPLPARAVKMMLQVLEAMSERTPVSMIPYEAELTTKQVADFLNVSRPYVTKIIDEGQLTARKINRHRRVLFADLVSYQKQLQKEQKAAISEMIEDAEELGLE